MSLFSIIPILTSYFSSSSYSLLIPIPNTIRLISKHCFFANLSILNCRLSLSSLLRGSFNSSTRDTSQFYSPATSYSNCSSVSGKHCCDDIVISISSRRSFSSSTSIGRPRMIAWTWLKSLHSSKSSYLRAERPAVIIRC